MPPKKNGQRKYGEKLISLFARLLFSRQSHSLTELSRMLDCSKQTVLKLIRDIKMAYSIDIEETVQNRHKYYRIRRKFGVDPSLNLTETEVNTLQMCRAFTEHLLGRKFFDQATQALGKSMAHLPENKRGASKHFATFIPGSIDYSDHHEIILQLIQAMEERKVCKLTYKRPLAKRAKTYYIKPLKIFSHKDTIYLHTRIAKYPGKPYKEPDFDPLLAIHRIKAIQITGRFFEFPKDYNFEKVFNKNFGVIKEDAFDVEVEFSGFAAAYVSERIWSPDQNIIKKNGTTKLCFSASSEPELMSWVLSFGNEAKVKKPQWLKKEIKDQIGLLDQVYQSL